MPKGKRNGNDRSFCGTMTSTQGSPLLQALADHKVTASVVDLDHYRIQGGLAVETDYIILVEPTGETGGGETFEPFRYVQIQTTSVVFL